MYLRSVSLLPFVYGALAACSAPGASAPSEMLGSASVAITQIPQDVSCVRLTMTGTARRDVRMFDVQGGGGSTLSMANLPLGTVTFLGEAFPSACAGVGPTSAPNWVSDSVSAKLVSTALVNVAISMHRSGRAGVGVSFDDDGGVARKVTTLAGCAGSSGAVDGVGAAARFVNPTRIAADGQGNIYVTDDGATVRKIVIASGQVTTIAGVAGVTGDVDGVGSAARLKGAASIAFSGECLYFVEHSAVRQVCPSTGAVSTIAGDAAVSGYVDGPPAFARFSDLTGIAADEIGSLFVLDSDSSTVRMIADGRVSTIAGTPGQRVTVDGVGSAASFTQLFDIAADGMGHLFVADAESIRRIDIGTATVTTVAPVAASGIAAGLLVLATDAAHDSVWELDPLESKLGIAAGTSGQPGTTDGTGAQARFRAPQGIALDRAGTAYVADSANFTVRKIQ